MLARTGVAGLALVLSLSACSGDPEPESGPGPATSDPPGDPLTEVTISCPEFEDTARRIAEAQAELYSGTSDAEVVDSLVAELDALKEGAPEEVRSALDDMGAGFREAAELLADPSAKDRAALARLAPELAADGETITAYITTQCG